MVNPIGQPLVLYNVHTHERFVGGYRGERGPIKRQIQAISGLMRDHHRNEIMLVDPGLIELLGALSRHFTGPKKQPPVICILSGYRSPETNASLAKTGEGVAVDSLHMQGRAVDIYIEGVPLALVHAEAVALKVGGVGYYPQNGFIHIDTGRVRYWQRPAPIGNAPLNIATKSP